MSEQRRHQRKRVVVDFTCRDESGTGELAFSTADLSTGGAFLTSSLLLEQGERLALEVSLAGSERITADAEVAWVRRFPRSDEEAGMGVKFLTLTDADRKALEAFLAAAG